MPSAGGVIWSDTRLFAKMAVFTELFEVGLERYMESKEDEAESYMKANAPWQDRTGEAREGLTAEASKENGDVVLDIFHTVDYGIWLEVRWNGLYAIIEPTVQHFGGQVMADASFGTILL